MTRLQWLAPLAMIALLAACAGSNPLSYNGRMAQPDGRMAIKEGGPFDETWQNNDLIIRYTYRRQADAFEMNGRVELQDRLNGLPTVDFLRVNIHFLDAEGVILDSKRLWTALGEGGLGGKDFFIDWQFDQTFVLLQSTRNMTFSYQGRVADQSSGDDSKLGGGVGIDFWRTP